METVAWCYVRTAAAPLYTPPAAPSSEGHGMEGVSEAA